MIRFGIFCGKWGWCDGTIDEPQFSKDAVYPFKSHAEAIIYGFQTGASRMPFVVVRSMKTERKAKKS